MLWDIDTDLETEAALNISSLIAILKLVDSLKEDDVLKDVLCDIDCDVEADSERDKDIELLVLILWASASAANSSVVFQVSLVKPFPTKYVISSFEMPIL